MLREENQSPAVKTLETAENNFSTDSLFKNENIEKITIESSPKKSDTEK